MAYLEEFKHQINTRNVTRFLQLWEEYCNNDTVDAAEFIQALEMLKHSDLATPLGPYIETALPLWSLIQDEKDSGEVLRLIIDLQTTNSELLAETSFQFLKNQNADDKFFNEKMRLVGLRHRHNFQGAISNYQLLTHMQKGHFVFHGGGWGTGEIMEISLVREELIIEFDNIDARKDLSFENAFKTLTPLDDDHFLTRRFSDPDTLEAEAKKAPLKVMHSLLKDLGPKTASEIKDEMCVLIIPEEDWTRWWQGTRAKMKKDTMIESPSSIKEPFSLRESELSHEDRFQKKLEGTDNIDELLLTSYNFVRDLPDLLKNKEFKESLKNRFVDFLSDGSLTAAQELQIAIFLENLFNHKVPGKTVKDKILEDDKYLNILSEISILSFKKRVLVAIKKYQENWIEFYVDLLFALKQNILRDHILTELNNEDSQGALYDQISHLLHHPKEHPDAFVWYFQKLVSGKSIPLNSAENICRFFEGFLTLYHAIEMNTEQRDLTKKMYNLMTGERFAIIREILAKSTITDVKEFILLLSKCQTLSNHDKKIFRSLVEVVHPSLSSDKQKTEDFCIWTTEEGYNMTKERVEHIATIEVVENAKEIEEARALGDLKENSEFKYAQERRARLQAELKLLTEQLNRARIITPEDISKDEIGIGNIVDLKDGNGNTISYSILGPWDADPDKNILSFQSKFALSMSGCKAKSKVQFKDEEYTVASIKSYLQTVKDS
jgi:transcription elongation factor GreA-like protein/transcription elongation GreA/GreB family factor